MGGNLHLLGFRDDVPKLLKAAVIYVLPSIREGINVSLMEAMASGLPIACGRIRDNIDLLTEGYGGFLFNPEKEDEIKNSLEMLIKMSRKEVACLGGYSLQKIRKFSDKAVDKKMCNIYGGLRAKR